MGMKKYILGLTLICLTLVIGGCDENRPAPPTDSTKQEQSTPQKPVAPPADKKESEQPHKTKPAEAKREISVKLYFPNDQGTKLIPVEKKVTVSTDDKTDKYKAALGALIGGTTEKGQSNIIPRRAKLNAVKLDGDKLTVDFSGEIVKNFVGGSTGEEMLIGSVVNTLTEFPEVKKVRILVDGEEVESLSGHMDLTQPFTRMENLLK